RALDLHRAVPSMVRAQFYDKLRSCTNSGVTSSGLRKSWPKKAGHARGRTGPGLSDHSTIRALENRIADECRQPRTGAAVREAASALVPNGHRYTLLERSWSVRTTVPSPKPKPLVGCNRSDTGPDRAL